MNNMWKFKSVQELAYLLKSHHEININAYIGYYTKVGDREMVNKIKQAQRIAVAGQIISRESN